MVENPASFVGSDMANRAIDADASVSRVEELARRGTQDPATLTAEDVRDVCAALVSHIDKGSGG